MKTMTAEQTLDAIEEGAKQNVQEVRRIERMETNKEWIRQGDVYIYAVPDEHPHGAKAKSKQLAIGNTQGSRHMAPDHAEVYEGTTRPEGAPTGLLGPLFKLFKRGTVTHPEHAWHDLPKGTYQVVHQLDAITLGRVQD